MNGTTVGPQWPYPGENTYYPAASTDPVRVNAPYTPVDLVDPTTAPSLPIVGVLVVVAVLFLFEHLRRKKGR